MTILVEEECREARVPRLTINSSLVTTRAPRATDIRSHLMAGRPGHLRRKSMLMVSSSAMETIEMEGRPTNITDDLK